MDKNHQESIGVRKPVKSKNLQPKIIVGVVFIVGILIVLQAFVPRNSIRRICNNLFKSQQIVYLNTCILHAENSEDYISYIFPIGKAEIQHVQLGMQGFRYIDGANIVDCQTKTQTCEIE